MCVVVSLYHANKESGAGMQLKLSTKAILVDVIKDTRPLMMPKGHGPMPASIGPSTPPSLVQVNLLLLQLRVQFLVGLLSRRTCGIPWYGGSTQVSIGACAYTINYWQTSLTITTGKLQLPALEILVGKLSKLQRKMRRIAIL